MIGSMAVCFSCHAALSELDTVARHTKCPECGADAKVCLNCRFYDPSAHWECKEDIPEEVKVKDQANFCEFFQLRLDDTPGKRTAKENPAEQDRARRKFEQLFDDE